MNIIDSFLNFNLIKAHLQFAQTAHKSKIAKELLSSARQKNAIQKTKFLFSAHKDTGVQQVNLHRSDNVEQVLPACNMLVISILICWVGTGSPPAEFFNYFRAVGQGRSN